MAPLVPTVVCCEVSKWPLTLSIPLGEKTLSSDKFTLNFKLGAFYKAKPLQVNFTNELYFSGSQAFYGEGLCSPQGPSIKSKPQIQLYFFILWMDSFYSLIHFTFLTYVTSKVSCNTG